MADVTEVIKRLIVEAQTRGLDKSAAEFEKMGSTAKQAATTVENSLASTGRAFETAANKADPLRKVIKDLAKDLRDLESGRGKGLSDEYINSLKEGRTAAAGLAMEAAKTNAALGQQAQAMGQHARAAGLSGNAMKNLGFQLNDAVTMLASGSSLFQVMATQGGQVTQELQGGGGIVANVKDLGTRLVGLVTPARVAFGGIAAGAALAGMAMAEHAAATKEFENTLKGIGRGSGATVDQLMAISEAAAKSGDITVAAARDYANAFARTGKIGKENIEPLAASVENFAATVGVDAKDAVKTLATAFADPAKGIDTLAAALGGVNGELRETVINFAESGQGAKAQAAMMEVLEKNTLKARDALSVWGKMAHDIAKDFDELRNITGKALSPATDPEKLQRIQAERDAIRSGAVPEATPGGNQQRLAELDQEYDRIKKIVEATERQAQVNRDVAEAKARSVQADRTVEKVFPDARQLQQVENQIKLITDALADDEKGWNKLTEATRRNYQDTLESLNVQKQAKEGGRFAGQFGEGPVGARMARREEDATNQIAAVTAITQAEQQAIAVATALTAARREGATAAEQQQIATNTLAVAQATASTEMQKALNAQQGQISGLQQLQGAVGQGATAMAVLTAKLQEEQALRAAGINIMSAEAQQRIANAGIIAQETAALQDQVKARQTLQQARGQVQMLKAETAMISSAGADYGDPREAALREMNLSILKGQIEARRLSQEGLTEEAAAVRQSSKAVAKATYARDVARIEAQEAAAHAKELADLGDYGAYRAINQGINPSVMKQIMAAEKQQDAADEQIRAANRQVEAASWSRAPGGPSSFSTKWAPKTQESTINAPPGYETVLTGSVHGGRAGGGLSYDVSYVKGKELLAQEAEQASAAREKRAGGVKQQSDLARQTLQTAISTANSALGKQIEALRDATERSTDAQDRRTELEGKLKEQEDKRQQRIQNYLAAGPSPFEQNADIFYDPKKRMAFAESIAGSVDESLKVQIAAARAEADAADAAQESAEAQIKTLEAQQEALQYQSELLSAGVDLSKAEVDGINALINEIRSGLPENIATQFSRIFQAQAAQATQQSADIQKATGVGGGSYAMQTTTGMGGGGSAASPLGSYSAFAYDPYSSSTSLLRRNTIGFASGGEFTVPGSYGAGDRPFVMGLAGQEKVTIQTPGQQRSGGSRGTSIENLIVQMPPMTDPIIYLNKRSRPALGRAIRNTARGMN